MKIFWMIGKIYFSFLSPYHDWKNLFLTYILSLANWVIIWVGIRELSMSIAIVGHAQECQGIWGRSHSKKGKWVSGLRTRANNNEQVMFPVEPNFPEKQCKSLEPDHLVNTVQETTMLRRISFKEISQ